MDIMEIREIAEIVAKKLEKDVLNVYKGIKKTDKTRILNIDTEYGVGADFHYGDHGWVRIYLVDLAKPEVQIDGADIASPTNKSVAGMVEYLMDRHDYLFEDTNMSEVMGL